MVLVRCLSARRSSHQLGYGRPIDPVEDCANVVRPAVLVIQVIGVFPDITNQYRLQAFGQGCIGIGGLDDFQRFAFGCQPDPTATKLTDAASNELGFKLLIAAEAGVDRVGDSPFGLPATVRADAVPEDELCNNSATVTFFVKSETKSTIGSTSVVAGFA